MKKRLVQILRLFGFTFLFREVLQRNKVSILLFHDIDKETARKVFSYLQRKYNLISLETYLEAITTKKNLPPKALIITIDDGYIGNHQLLPVIKELNIPITLFACASIIGTNRHFWSDHRPLPASLAHLKGLPDNEKLELMATVGFNKEKEYDYPLALQKEQVLEMKPYIDIQAHALFHPSFPKLKYEDAKKEIFESKKILENQYGLNIKAIAYPNGEYSLRDIQLAKEAGYQCALTVDYGFNTTDTDPFRLRRIVVNDDCSMHELIVKACGLWGFVETRNGRLFGVGLTETLDDQYKQVLSPVETSPKFS